MEADSFHVDEGADSSCFDCLQFPMEDRIQQAFARAKKNDNQCFVAYICAGDPNYEQSVEICRTLLASGVDILEVGLPFSDPLADGYTNQCAAQRSLDAGMTQEKVFDLVREVRSFDEQTPIVFYAYFNQIFSQGVECFMKRALEAGVDGVLALDLPPVEADEYLKTCDEVGMKTVFVVAPTTPEERIESIADSVSGFIYYVSREGVTGVQDSLDASLASGVKRIKAHTDKPVAVGFGISTREQVREVADVADGVVVGSAIVNVIAEHVDAPEEMLKQLAAKASDLSAGVRG